MEEKFNDELASRMYIKYMFEPDKFLDHFYKEKWDTIDLIIVFTAMEDFCEHTYYPKRYRNELQMALSKIRETKDEHTNGRTTVINQMIMVLNETENVRDCNRYLDEIEKRGITKIPDDINDIINQYLNDLDDDMYIFNTHGRPGNLANRLDIIERNCNDVRYYKTIKYLMNEYEWLKNSSVFMDNLNEVIKYATKWKVRRYIKKEFTTK